MLWGQLWCRDVDVIGMLKVMVAVFSMIVGSHDYTFPFQLHGFTQEYQPTVEIQPKSEPNQNWYQLLPVEDKEVK